MEEGVPQVPQERGPQGRETAVPLTVPLTGAYKRGTFGHGKRKMGARSPTASREPKRALLAPSARALDETSGLVKVRFAALLCQHEY